jgi:hypothetical protein
MARPPRSVDLVTVVLEHGRPVLLIVSGAERFEFVLAPRSLGALLAAIGALVARRP